MDSSGTSKARPPNCHGCYGCAAFEVDNGGSFPVVREAVVDRDMRIWIPAPTRKDGEKKAARSLHAPPWAPCHSVPLITAQSGQPRCRMVSQAAGHAVKPPGIRLLTSEGCAGWLVKSELPQPVCGWKQGGLPRTRRRSICASRNPSSPSVPAGQPLLWSCKVHVHAKTALTEPLRHQARQQSGSGGVWPGQGARLPMKSSPRRMLIAGRRPACAAHCDGDSPLVLRHRDPGSPHGC